MLTVIEDYRLDIVLPANKNEKEEKINIDKTGVHLVGVTTEMGEI